MVFHCILIQKVLSPAKRPYLKYNEFLSQSFDIFETVFKEKLNEDLSYCRPSYAALVTWVSNKTVAGMPQLVPKILSQRNRPVINKEAD